MRKQNEEISWLMRQKRAEIAERAVALQYERQPEVWQAFGTKGREKSVRDLHDHLFFLAEAITVADQTLFADYSAWVAELFTSLNFPEDVWEIKREYLPGEKKNSTKLPDELVEKLIQYSSKLGDVVMDPFMGNGTTAVASIKLQRNYVGFEVNPNAQEIIDQNILEAKKQIKE